MGKGMSDFIYTNQAIKNGELTKDLHSIYHEDFPEVKEFLGDWGALAVSQNPYNGFQSYENSEHICVVIGGPVLFFRDNLFLNNGPETEGTQAIYERWKNGAMCWDEDLSGPFTIFIINKQSAEIFCVTDLMSYIPVFMYQTEKKLMLSTHLNALAQASNQQFNMDLISKVDFILHGIVTFPYTVYRNISQIPPSSIHITRFSSLKLKSEYYWVPEERETSKPIGQVAENLREALQNYVNNITDGMPQIAQFISGGEDSRVISALLPKESNRQAFIFLDSMNREGKRAKKAADAYGAEFNLFTRCKSHYLDILPAAADMIGDGAEYFHAHSLKLANKAKLVEYPAVFGGFCSDSLLKAACIVQPRVISRFPFMPQMRRKGLLRGDPVENSIFRKELLAELKKRRAVRLDFIKKYRNESAEEWFELWPSSMNDASPNVHVNRRLFRNYEPFMANAVVKICATVPQEWKLNRRLFHKMAKPYLKQTKWLFHSDGRLPYFPWYINSGIQFVVWGYQQTINRLGLDKKYQGSWGEWNFLFKNGEFQRTIDKYSDGVKVMATAFNEPEINKVFKSNELGLIQRINLLHTLYSNQKNVKAIEEEILDAKYNNFHRFKN